MVDPIVSGKLIVCGRIVWRTHWDSNRASQLDTCSGRCLALWRYALVPRHRHSRHERGPAQLDPAQMLQQYQSSRQGLSAACHSRCPMLIPALPAHNCRGTLIGYSPGAATSNEKKGLSPFLILLRGWRQCRQNPSRLWRPPQRCGYRYRHRALRRTRQEAGCRWPRCRHRPW